MYITDSARSTGVFVYGVSGSGGDRRMLCEVSCSALVDGREVEWQWSNPDNGEAGETVFIAQGAGLELKLAAELLNGPLLDLDLRIESKESRVINKLAIHVDFLPSGFEENGPELLDDCHVPHLVPRPGLVMADMVFRSPAVVLKKGRMALALLPDLNCLGESRSAPWALDFDLKGPLGVPRITLSLVQHSLDHHVYFREEPESTIEIPEEGSRLSCHLMTSGQADDDFHRRVQAFLWERYGVANYHAVKPQVMSLDESAREAMNRLFKREDLYFEFEYRGERCAGVAAHACTTKKELKALGPLATRVMSPLHGISIVLWLKALNFFSLSRGADGFLFRTLHNQGIPFIAESQFMSWFNNLRTAYGARILANKWGDERLVEQADLIKNLALSAPVEDGIFSAICTFPRGKVWWHRGTLSFKAIEDYHTPDQATTGYIMLKWYRDIEQDPALMDMARGLGGFFAKHQLPSGAVPAWIQGHTHRPLPRLLESASTAGPMMFMAMLASLDRDEKWLHSAGRMADFITREVLPDHKWYDYETFYSCSKQRKDPRDPRTGVLPQNTMSKWWAAEGARILAEITGEEKYFNLLLKCLDDLLWHQQVWDAPYISINTFGGFGSMNTDGEWNDARQGCIAPVLMDAYLLTGDPHHFQRGVAALRSCYTTMLHPAMREVAPGNMAHYRESDRGAVYENYAHLGYDSVCAGYLEPDWGAGTAAYATAHASKFYGDVFIDLDREQAFGVNGVAVKGLEREGDIVRLKTEAMVEDMREPRVVIKGAGPNVKLLITGTEHPHDKFQSPS